MVIHRQFVGFVFVAFLELSICTEALLSMPLGFAISRGGGGGGRERHDFRSDDGSGGGCCCWTKTTTTTKPSSFAEDVSACFARSRRCHCVSTKGAIRFPTLLTLCAKKGTAAASVDPSPVVVAADGGIDVRDRYVAWCLRHGKNYDDEKRLATFSETYERMRRCTRSKWSLSVDGDGDGDGDDSIPLGRYADCTWKEYALASGLDEAYPSQMTVKELREECRRRDLIVGGMKAELIERLRASLRSEMAMEDDDNEMREKRSIKAERQRLKKELEDAERNLNEAEQKSMLVAGRIRAGKKATWLMQVNEAADEAAAAAMAAKAAAEAARIEENERKAAEEVRRLAEKEQAATEAAAAQAQAVRIKEEERKAAEEMRRLAEKEKAAAEAAAAQAQAARTKEEERKAAEEARRLAEEKEKAAAKAAQAKAARIEEEGRKASEEARRLAEEIARAASEAEAFAETVRNKEKERKIAEEARRLADKEERAAALSVAAADEAAEIEKKKLEAFESTLVTKNTAATFESKDSSTINDGNFESMNATERAREDGDKSDKSLLEDLGELAGLLIKRAMREQQEHGERAKKEMARWQVENDAFDSETKEDPMPNDEHKNAPVSAKVGQVEPKRTLATEQDTAAPKIGLKETDKEEAKAAKVNAAAREAERKARREKQEEEERLKRERLEAEAIESARAAAQAQAALKKKVIAVEEEARRRLEEAREARVAALRRLEEQAERAKASAKETTKVAGAITPESMGKIFTWQPSTDGRLRAALGLESNYNVDAEIYEETGLSTGEEAGPATATNLTSANATTADAGDVSSTKEEQMNYSPNVKRSGVYVSGFPVSDVFPLLFPSRTNASTRRVNADIGKTTEALATEVDKSSAEMNTSVDAAGSSMSEGQEEGGTGSNSKSVEKTTIAASSSSSTETDLSARLNEMFASFWKKKAGASKTRVVAPAPPIDSQITFFGTSNLDATATFYETAMNLTLSFDCKTCRIYQTSPGAHIGFFYAGDDSVPSTSFSSSPSTTAGASILTLVTEDVDGWAKRLESFGISLERRPTLDESLGVYHLFVRDPNNYQIEIRRFENPSWRR